ncbi:MAG: aspartate-semialdehyde dehydrogenase [Deltaproteobacteria bacterium]
MKIKVGILGCTGAVGQKFISLLNGHPFFEISELVASESSAGKLYKDRVNWKETSPYSEKTGNITIKKIGDPLDAKILFSGLDSSVAGEAETMYAEKGFALVSNSKNHRMADNVPLVIPEVNNTHFKLIHFQQSYSKSGGFIVTNPNCAIVVMAIALYPIHRDFGLSKVMVTTMQAISGAGYPGVPSLDILGNVIPHIADEEKKVETEAQKIFGVLNGAKVDFADFMVSASCNRVPVRDGHSMSISFATKTKATKEDIIKSLSNFPGLGLASSPEDVLLYYDNPFRPQPLLDVNTGRGMTVTVANLRKCNILNFKMSALGHNTIRGAAGAAILNAEFLLNAGYIK